MFNSPAIPLNILIIKVISSLTRNHNLNSQENLTFEGLKTI